MAFAYSTITGLDATAYAGDKPVLVGENILNGDGATITAKWTAGGTDGGADITNTSYPASWLYDGFLNKDSRPNAAAQVRYLNFACSADESFDYFFMHLNHASLHASTTLTVEACTDSDGNFTPATQIYPIQASDYLSGSDKRVFYPEVRVSGDAAGVQRRFTGLRYFRIKFDAGGGNTHTPQVNQVWIGLQAQLHHHAWRPYDPDARSSMIERFESKTGIITSSAGYKGKKVLSADLILDTAVQKTRLIGWHTATDYGSRPFLWVEEPQTPIAGLYILDDPNFNFPEVGIFERPFKLVAIEQGGSLLVDE